MRIGPAPPVAPPIDEFIVKVASRCNINCDYCYEFNQGDDTWRGLPALMSPDVAALVAGRIREHAADHDLDEVSISFHGGEPLVLGAKRLDELIQTFVNVFRIGGPSARFALQTNGVLLTDSIIGLLKTHKVAVGISLDGGRKHNDRHRLSKAGRSTFEKSAQGIRRLAASAPELFAGVLAVVDLENDAVEVVDELFALGAQNVDLLLPHYNWQRPPPRKSPNSAEYSEWYLAVWRAWTSDRWPGLSIRFLENLVRRLVGHPGIYEQMSLSPASMITVNTAGGIEGVDTLKSAGHGSQVTGLHLATSAFNDVLSTPEYVDRCYPLKALCKACQACEFAEICVGGYLPHRFSQEAGFLNPSVYCQDLKALIPSLEAALTK